MGKKIVENRCYGPGWADSQVMWEPSSSFCSRASPADIPAAPWASCFLSDTSDVSPAAADPVQPSHGCSFSRSWPGASGLAPLPVQGRAGAMTTQRFQLRPGARPRRGSAWGVSPHALATGPPGPCRGERLGQASPGADVSRDGRVGGRWGEPLHLHRWAGHPSFGVSGEEAAQSPPAAAAPPPASSHGPPGPTTA